MEQEPFSVFSGTLNPTHFTSLSAKNHYKNVSLTSFKQ